MTAKNYNLFQQFAENFLVHEKRKQNKQRQQKKMST